VSGSTEVVDADVTARPLAQPPAYDGMPLEPALTRVWGSVPGDAWLQHLKGDLSARSYYRVGSDARTPGTLVVMRFAADGGEHELPFVNLQRHLSARGVRVPRLYADDTRWGVLLLEDLGDETFERRLHARGRAAWPALYAQAIDVLHDLHVKIESPDPACIAYGRGFDGALLRWELEHFRDFGLCALGCTPSEADHRTLDAAFEALCTRILALPQGMAHRDYQSRNLMWVDDALVVIDFQDALRGPVVYDLVALLCDSYVPIDAALQQALVAHYAARAGLDAAALLHAFDLVAVQRKLKDAGRMVFADRVRGNADFLQWFGPSLRYVGRALTRLADPQLDGLAALLARSIPGYPDAVPTPEARTGVSSIAQ
jgi:N-acetylmuramate 1-kinase